MQVTQRIPTSQFAYIEFTTDYETAEDALEENARLVKAYEEPGLPQNEWARVRNAMLVTGEFDPNIEGLSKAQRYFINQLKLALRAHKDGQ